MKQKYVSVDTYLPNDDKLIAEPRLCTDIVRMFKGRSVQSGAVDQL